MIEFADRMLTTLEGNYKVYLYVYSYTHEYRMENLFLINYFYTEFISNKAVVKC